MMRCPSSATYLENLDPAVYLKLQDCLDLHGSWKQLIYVMPSRYSKGLMEIIDRDKLKEGLTPSRILLQHLDSKMVRLSKLITWLEAAKLINSLLLLKAEEPLEILQHPPTTVLAYDGYLLTLSCEATSFPPPEFQWFKDGEELLLQQEKNLSIKHASSKHSGSYSCRIRAFYSRGPSECFTNSCQVTVIPPFDEAVKIRKKAVMQSIQEESISSCDTKDSSNSVGGSNGFIDLDVQEKEKRVIEILRQPVSPGEVRQGSTILLTCLARSAYHLSYQWHCNGLVMEGQTNAELRLEHLFSDSHNKETVCKYMCMVYHSFGHRFSDCVVVKLSPSDRNTCYEAEEKIAFLIANEFYKDTADSLVLPSNDVVTVAGLLKSLGFKVISLKNLDRLEMKNSVKRYCETLGQGKYGFVYVAGHGLQLCKQTYLMPTDCVSEFRGLSPQQISALTICTDCILDQMQSKEPALIVQVFDVCRSTPKDTENIFPAKCCQAQVKGNTFRCYSTAPFCSAHECDEESNGYFVKHLQNFLTKPRAEIEEIFKEVKVAFRNDPAVPESQHPTTEFSSDEFRRLDDKVRSKGQSIFDRKFFWTNSEETLFSPLYYDISFPDSCDESSSFPEAVLYFYHHRKTFCNSMDVYIYLDIPANAALEELSEVEISLEFDGFRTITKHPSFSYKPDTAPLISIVEVHDLQRAKGSIVGKIIAQNPRTKTKFLEEYFDLGEHPVSKMKLTDPNDTEKYS